MLQVSSWEMELNFHLQGHNFRNWPISEQLENDYLHNNSGQLCVFLHNSTVVQRWHRITVRSQRQVLLNSKQVWSAFLVQWWHESVINTRSACWSWKSCFNQIKLSLSLEYHPALIELMLKKTLKIIPVFPNFHFIIQNHEVEKLVLRENEANS